MYLAYSLSSKEPKKGGGQQMKNECMSKPGKEGQLGEHEIIQRWEGQRTLTKVAAESRETWKGRREYIPGQKLTPDQL